MAVSELQLSPGLAEYLVSVSPPEPDVLRRLREETSTLEHAQMQISAEQGQLFQFLVRAIGARRCLEIGVFTGYSSTVVAMALPDGGHLTACDVNPEWTATARRYWKAAGVDGKIELILGPALETLDRLLADGRAGSYDFAFIDADKPNYPGYWDRALELLRKGGVIAVDNVLWSGRVVDPSVTDAGTRAIREFNRKVAADPRVYSLILPMRDGITLAVKI